MCECVRQGRGEGETEGERGRGKQGGEEKGRRGGAGREQLVMTQPGRGS